MSDQVWNGTTGVPSPAPQSAEPDPDGHRWDGAQLRESVTEDTEGNQQHWGRIAPEGRGLWPALPQ